MSNIKENERRLKENYIHNYTNAEEINKKFEVITLNKKFELMIKNELIINTYSVPTEY